MGFLLNGQKKRGMVSQIKVKINDLEQFHATTDNTLNGEENAKCLWTNRHGQQKPKFEPIGFTTQPSIRSLVLETIKT